MKNLMLENIFVCFRIMKVDHTIWLDFQLGSFELYVTGYTGQMRKDRGYCRFYLYYKSKTIFHSCDLCVVPRIRGVNL